MDYFINYTEVNPTCNEEILYKNNKNVTKDI